MDTGFLEELKMDTGFLIVVMFFGFVLAVIGLCLFSFTKEELAEFRKLSKIKKFRWVLVKLLLFVVGVTGVFIILWAMQTCGKDVTAKKKKSPQWKRNIRMPAILSVKFMILILVQKSLQAPYQKTIWRLINSGMQM